MREIKFRGKDIETGEWIYGDLIQRIGYMPSIMYTYEHTGKIRYCECAVKRETVGQFAGLTDKNGKEIYEGDIIKSSYGTIHYIVYDNDLACFKAVVARYNPSNEYSNLSKGWIACLNQEVIGNVHDNPELI